MGILLNLTKEYFIDDIRDEEGIKINIDGVKYIIKYNDHPSIKNICPVVEETGDMFIKRSFDFFEEDKKDVYIISSEADDGYNDYYFIAKKDLKKYENGAIGDDLKFFFKSDLTYIDDSLTIIDVLNETGMIESCDIAFGDNEEIKIEQSQNFCLFSCDVSEIIIFDDEYEADSEALNRIYDYLNSEYGNSMKQDEFDNFVNSYGRSWINDDAIEESYEEYIENYIDDIENENGIHGIRLFDEMIENNIIEDNSEYFEINLSEPKFDPYDYKEELINAISEKDDVSEEESSETVESLDEEEFIANLVKYDVVEKSEEYFNLDYEKPTFSIEEMKDKLKQTKISEEDLTEKFFSISGELDSSYYSLDTLSGLMLEKDGRGVWLSDFDDEEYTCEIDDKTYFLYIKY